MARLSWLRQPSRSIVVNGPTTTYQWRGMARLASGHGVEGVREDLRDPGDLRLGDHERRGHLEGDAAQQPGDHATLADAGDQPGPDPRVRGAGVLGDLHGGQQPGPGTHLADQFVPGQ